MVFTIEIRSPAFIRLFKWKAHKSHGANELNPCVSLIRRSGVHLECKTVVYTPHTHTHVYSFWPTLETEAMFRRSSFAVLYLCAEPINMRRRVWNIFADILSQVDGCICLCSCASWGHTSRVDVVLLLQCFFAERRGDGGQKYLIYIRRTQILT